MAAFGLPPPLMVPRESLRPPSADSPRAGLAMSALAHAGLMAALALGVQWRTEEPTAVSAELWTAVPQIAAPARPEPVETPDPTPPPRPVVTPPAPPPAAEREADIAIEKARRLREDKARQEAEDQRRKALEQKAQQEKAERDKAEKLEAQRKEKAAEKAADAQREKLRQEQMRRMAEQLGGGPAGTGAPGSTGTAARDAGPSANYGGRIVARIKPNIVLTDEVAGNPRAEVELRVGADGSIVGRRISQSSGSKVWDEAVLRAVDRTGILPRDTDGRVPPTIVVGFRPRD